MGIRFPRRCAIDALDHIDIGVGLVGGAFHSWHQKALAVSSPYPELTCHLCQEASGLMISRAGLICVLHTPKPSFLTPPPSNQNEIGPQVDAQCPGSSKQAVGL